MKTRGFSHPSDRMFIVALLAGLWIALSVPAAEEDMGITVSRTAPAAAEAAPQKTAPASGRTVWIVLAAGGVALLSGLALLKAKKSKNRATETPVVKTPEPAPQPAKKPQPAPALPPQPPAAKPVVQPAPAAKPQPAPAAPKPQPPPAPAPKIPTPPPAPQPAPAPVPPVKQPEPAPELPRVAPVAAKPVEVKPPAPAVEKPVESKPPEDDDDLLFKHLNLLKNLRDDNKTERD